MGRSATGLTVSASPEERQLIDEFTELTGETPTRLVRQLVFARLPHIIAALKEGEAAGINTRAIPNFELSPSTASTEQQSSFYHPDSNTWAEGE